VRILQQLFTLRDVAPFRNGHRLEQVVNKEVNFAKRLLDVFSLEQVLQKQVLVLLMRRHISGRFQGATRLSWHFFDLFEVLKFVQGVED